MRVIFSCTLLAAALFLGGCSRLYQVTFTHGSSVTVRGKPKYDPATDTFTMTDMRGNTGQVRAISVREIAPASSVKQPAKTMPYRTAP